MDCVMSKISLHNPNQEDFLLEIYSFYVLHLDLCSILK